MPIFRQHFDCTLQGSKRIYVIAVQRSSYEVVFATHCHFDYSYNLMGNLCIVKTNISNEKRNAFNTFTVNSLS